MIDRLPWEQYGLIGIALGSVLFILSAVVWKMMGILDKTLDKFNATVMTSTVTLQGLSDRVGNIWTSIESHRDEERVVWASNAKANEMQKSEHALILERGSQILKAASDAVVAATAVERAATVAAAALAALGNKS